MFVVNLEKGLTVREIEKDSIIDPFVQELKQNIEEVEKGGYEHFMLKEIFEQPQSITDTFRGRLISASHPISISSLKNIMKYLKMPIESFSFHVEHHGTPVY